MIGINNDNWQQELFRAHKTNEATLQQVEATALVLEQASVQQKIIWSMTQREQTTSDKHAHMHTQL